MPRVFCSRLISSKFFTESDPILAEALSYQNHSVFYSDQDFSSSKQAAQHSTKNPKESKTKSNRAGNGKAPESAPLETNEDKSQDLLFDRFKHRKHLGRFYFQDLKGSEEDEKKRISIEGFMKRHILLRLITGLCRGVFHFFLFLLLFVPKHISHVLAERTKCIITPAGEDSLYREMEVRVPCIVKMLSYWQVLALCINHTPLLCEDSCPQTQPISSFA
uniref:Uncharacterized protein n=1 Tax=Cryptomonas curvata TaxID=233186 RepID=A0A7S0MWS7_9CRYP